MRTKTEAKAVDQAFFMAVMDESAMQRVLDQHELDQIYLGPSQYNSILVLTKETWTLPYFHLMPKTLNIHFEARKPNEFRLEVGLEPYEGNIENKLELWNTLQPVLMLKAQIVAALRTRILGDPVTSPVHPTTNGLPSPEATRSHTAVKFVSHLPETLTPSQAASFYAAVITAAAPIVEAVVISSPPT